ncbi:conserved hypothetical protein [Gammaproteobacteria bacterium]
MREADGTTQLAGSDGPSPYQIPLQEEAKRRGVPLVWPIMDLVEASHLPLTDGKGTLPTALREASRDYPVEAVWLGRLVPPVTTTTEGKGVWTVHWTLVRGSIAEQWDTTGEEPAAALVAGVDKLAERLAVGVPIPGGGPLVQRPVVQIVVEGVVSLEDYAQLRKLLESLPEVVRSWPTYLTPEGRLTFTVEPRESAVVLAVALGKTGLLLAEDPPIDLSALGDTTRYYRLPPSPRK